MEPIKRILLVEDDEKDIELTVTALSEYNLANEIAIARDGVEALDYLYRRGAFAQRPNDNPLVILLDLKMPRLGVNAYVVKPVRFTAFVEAVKQIGVFWALINEPPPGSVKRG